MSLLWCVLTSLLLFGRSLAGDFVFDDVWIVRDNPLLAPLGSAWRLWGEPYLVAEAGLYRPATMLSFALNRAITGAAPWGFHLVNVTLHGLNAWVLGRLVARSAGSRLGWWTAAWFVVLPVHTEAVAGVVGRAELLACLGSLLAIDTVVRAADHGSSTWRTALGASAWTALAVLSKEHAAVALPLALSVVAAHIRLRGLAAASTWSAVRWPLGGMALALGACGLLRFAVLGEHALRVRAALIENPLAQAPLHVRTFSALDILGRYLGKSLWPAVLSSDYSYNQIPLVTRWMDAGMLLGLLLFVVAAGLSLAPWMTRSRRLAIAGLAAAWFFWPFLPASNLLVPIGTNMGERLMYLPSVGVCLALAAAAAWLWTWRWALLGRAIVVGLLVGYAGRSILRTGDWRDEATLYRSAAVASPRSVRALTNHGAVYLERGNLRAAEVELLAAQAISDRHFHTAYDLGLVYLLQGKHREAERQLLLALTLAPAYDPGYESLAFLYVEQGRVEEARAILQQRFDGDEQAVDRTLRQLFEAKAGRDDHYGATPAPFLIYAIEQAKARRRAAWRHALQ